MALDGSLFDDVFEISYKLKIMIQNKKVAISITASNYLIFSYVIEMAKPNIQTKLKTILTVFTFLGELQDFKILILSIFAVIVS